MGKTQSALTSLVAAIPAGVLTYLLVMAFLNKSDSLTTMMKVVAGLALASAFLVALMPILLLVLGNRKPKEAASAQETMSEADADIVSDDDDAEIEEADSSEDSVGVLDESDADMSSGEFEMGDSDADVLTDSSGELQTGSSLDDIEAVDFDEEEEEPKPKKRKK